LHGAVATDLSVLIWKFFSYKTIGFSLWINLDANKFYFYENWLGYILGRFSQAHMDTLVCRVARFFWYNIPKHGKIYHMTNTCNKWPSNIPNGRKIYLMATNEFNIFRCKTPQNFPKLV
jgi:hypothetical protein